MPGPTAACLGEDEDGGGRRRTCLSECAVVSLGCLSALLVAAAALRLLLPADSTFDDALVLDLLQTGVAVANATLLGGGRQPTTTTTTPPP